jgi:hypothetical protein
MDAGREAQQLPFKRASGTWWVGAQPITVIQLQAALALDEAQTVRRQFSGIAFLGDFGFRAPAQGGAA